MLFLWLTDRMSGAPARTPRAAAALVARRCRRGADGDPTLDLDALRARPVRRSVYQPFVVVLRDGRRRVEPADGLPPSSRMSCSGAMRGEPSGRGGRGGAGRPAGRRRRGGGPGRRRGRRRRRQTSSTTPSIVVNDAASASSPCRRPAAVSVALRELGPDARPGSASALLGARCRR